MSGAVQPYYAAWCRSQGVALEWQGPHTNHIYMAWIGARWAEFGFPIGSRLSELDREAFGRWLAERWPDTPSPQATAHYRTTQRMKPIAGDPGALQA